MSEPGDREWEHGWEGHADAQIRRLARLTLAEKLRWLEETERLVKAIEQARQRAGGGTPGEERRR